MSLMAICNAKILDADVNVYNEWGKPLMTYSGSIVPGEKHTIECFEKDSVKLQVVFDKSRHAIHLEYQFENRELQSAFINENSGGMKWNGRLPANIEAQKDEKYLIRSDKKAVVTISKNIEVSTYEVFTRSHSRRADTGNTDRSDDGNKLNNYNKTNNQIDRSNSEQQYNASTSGLKRYNNGNNSASDNNSKINKEALLRQIQSNIKNNAYVAGSTSNVTDGMTTCKIISVYDGKTYTIKDSNNIKQANAILKEIEAMTVEQKKLQKNLIQIYEQRKKLQKELNDTTANNGSNGKSDSNKIESMKKYISKIDEQNKKILEQQQKNAKMLRDKTEQLNKL